MRWKSISYPAKKKSSPSPRFEKKPMKSSVCARPSACGPIRIPSSSSTTTTGGANLLGSTATEVAASAATTTTAKNDDVSTWIIGLASARSLPYRGARLLDWDHGPPGRLVDAVLVGVQRVAERDGAAGRASPACRRQRRVSEAPGIQARRAHRPSHLHPRGRRPPGVARGVGGQAGGRPVHRRSRPRL